MALTNLLTKFPNKKVMIAITENRKIFPFFSTYLDNLHMFYKTFSGRQDKCIEGIIYVESTKMEEKYGRFQQQKNVDR